VRFFQIGLAVCVAGFLFCAARGGDRETVKGDSTMPPRTPSLEQRHDDHDHPHGSSENAVLSPDGTAEETAETPGSGRWPMILLGIYCVAIVGASLVGGWLPQFFELTHTRMQTIISLIGGLMLGIGVFHMLPHALVELGERGPDLAAYGMMGGIVVMFLLLRMFHFHHHGPTEVACSHTSDHAHDHGHDEGQKHSGVAAPSAHRFSWMGVFLGMSLHTLIDGLAVGASVEADALHGGGGLPGLGTFLAVALHKPLDSVAITSVMASGGWRPASRTIVNIAYALICPIGAGLFVLGIHEVSGQQSTIVGIALAVSAGVFVCIALSDLLPEMEFHSHNRVGLTAALLAGVAIAWAIRFLEPAHAHTHRHTEASHRHAG
jgi:zinc and cadmium transporter